jgi:hypothetical protein
MVVMSLKLQKHGGLKFIRRIIQSRIIGIGNYPRGEAERDKCGSNSPPLGAQVPLDTPLLAAGLFITGDKTYFASPCGVICFYFFYLVAGKMDARFQAGRAVDGVGFKEIKRCQFHESGH